MIYRRKIIIIAVAVVLCFIYVFITLILNNNNLFSVINPTYLVVENKIAWKKENDKWIDVSDLTKLEKIKFNIYTDEKTEGYISLTGSVDKIYIKENKQGNYKAKKIRAAISNDEVKLADYRVQKIDVKSDYYSLNVLENINRDLIDSFDGSVVTFDFDNDGKKESLYFVSNISIENTSGILTKVFLVDNNEMIEIESTGLYRFEILEILDLDKDKEYEIILEKKKKILNGYETCYQLYKFKNGKYENVKKCEL